MRTLLFGLLLASAALAAEPSPAERRIASAQADIAKTPKAAQGYTDLAAGYVRRARETADDAYLARGEEAVAKALALDPKNFEARRTRVALLIARKQFDPALDAARALNKEIPDDNLTYGLVADACIGLGRIQEAEKAAQWMIDMRPVNSPGFQRGATLRELFGDPEGALEWLLSAYRLTGAAETEEQAWLLTRMARIERKQNKTALAEKHLHHALDIFPGYPHALALLNDSAPRAQR